MLAAAALLMEDLRLTMATLLPNGLGRMIELPRIRARSMLVPLAAKSMLDQVQ